MVVINWLGANRLSDYTTENCIDVESPRITLAFITTTGKSNILLSPLLFLKITIRQFPHLIVSSELPVARYSPLFAAHLMQPACSFSANFGLSLYCSKKHRKGSHYSKIRSHFSRLHFTCSQVTSSSSSPKRTSKPTRTCS